MGSHQPLVTQQGGGRAGNSRASCPCAGSLPDPWSQAQRPRYPWTFPQMLLLYFSGTKSSGGSVC